MGAERCHCRDLPYLANSIRLMKTRSFLVLPALVIGGLLHAQLNISAGLTPTQLVQNVLVGNGVTVFNVSFNGVMDPATPQLGTGKFTSQGSNLGLDAGIILSSGTITGIAAPATDFISDPNDSGSDPDLLEITTAGNTINDKAVLEFDFIPTGDSLKFKYVFGSEEYSGFSCSPTFNDVFGFFLSGPGVSGPYTNGAANVALVPNTNLPVSIATIHGDYDSGCTPANDAYFVNNLSGTTVAYDGFTTVLEARSLVQCGQTYHIKLAVGDAGDESYDSGVFLQAGSFTSTGQVFPHLTTGVNVNDTTMFEGCGMIPFQFARLGDTTNTDTVHLVVTGTATPGVDYYPPLPAQLIYQPGDTLIVLPLYVPLDADGIETMSISITQNIVCSGQQVETNFLFYIDQPPPLQAVTDDVNGLCGQQYVLAPAISGGIGLYQYLWSTGATTPTITVGPDTTTTYYFTVTDTCSVVPYFDSLTVFIPQYDPLVLTADADLAIPCLDNADIGIDVLTGGNGSYEYAWSTSGAVVGTDASLNVNAGPPTWYYIHVAEGCGHSAVDSVLVTTVPLPNIVIGSRDTLVFCVGDTVLLRPLSLSGGNGVYTYAWSDTSGTVLSSADTLQVGVPVEATYMLTVQDQCGYRADSLFTTFVPHYAPFLIDLTPDSTICLGDSIALHALVTGGSGRYTIDWEGLGYSDPIYMVHSDEDVSFVVDVYDYCGEVISDQTTVTVQHPEAHILVMNQGEDDWLFQAATEPPIVPVMIWNLGDSTVTKTTAITHSYGNLLNHWVTLHMVSAEGCIADDSLYVYPPGGIYFPLAFTPDGDGFNDTFGPVNSSIEEFNMTIFDRWGHLVYTSEDVNKMWDGKVNGSTPATTGVYVYHYRAKGHYFPATENYGYVTLVRGSNGE